MKRPDAVARVGSLGHSMVDDPPANTLSNVSRSTCSRCGRSALCSVGNWYGSALEEPCPDVPRRELRTKFVDYDARRNPQSDRHCVRCQKDLKPSQKVRWVHCVNGGLYALHPEDEKLYVSDAGEMGWFPIGEDCARILGLEWTHPPDRNDRA